MKFGKPYFQFETFYVLLIKIAHISVLVEIIACINWCRAYCINKYLQSFNPAQNIWISGSKTFVKKRLNETLRKNNSQTCSENLTKLFDLSWSIFFSFGITECKTSFSRSGWAVWKIRYNKIFHSTMKVVMIRFLI